MAVGRIVILCVYLDFDTILDKHDGHFINIYRIYIEINA